LAAVPECGQGALSQAMTKDEYIATPGFYTDPRRQCTCTLPQILRYKAKLSGPLLDRINIQVEVPPINFQEISTERLGES
jgi:predicted ATPase with chaperone activity